jgi:hypothetical protein
MAIKATALKQSPATKARPRSRAITTVMASILNMRSKAKQDISSKPITTEVELE